jgi:hypothetical protein
MSIVYIVLPIFSTAKPAFLVLEHELFRQKGRIAFSKDSLYLKF